MYPPQKRGNGSEPGKGHTVQSLIPEQGEQVMVPVARTTLLLEGISTCWQRGDSPGEGSIAEGLRPRCDLQAAVMTGMCNTDLDRRGLCGERAPEAGRGSHEQPGNFQATWQRADLYGPKKITLGKE